MVEIQKKNKLNEVKSKFEELLAKYNNKVPSLLTDAIRDILAAIEYKDYVLVDSSVQALCAGLVSVGRDVVTSELSRSEATKASIRQVWQEDIDGQACENFDELKNFIEAFIDQRIAKMTEVQNDIVLNLAKLDYHVENAQQLEDGIRGMRKFRENILKEWPAANKPPAPVNQNAVAEARKAFAGGYKGLSKDQLVWGADAPKTGNQ
jgi:hypothetical protein